MLIPDKRTSVTFDMNEIDCRKEIKKDGILKKKGGGI